MKPVHVLTVVLLMCYWCSIPRVPQSVATNNNPVAPTLVDFSDVLHDANGKPTTGRVGVTFLPNKDSRVHFEEYLLP